MRARAHRAAGGRRRAGACSAGHAELLCGAQEWWNAATVSHFWRTWNLPVHHWILRSAHAPALRAGAGKMGAVVACFALSAVLHELAVAVPLRVMCLRLYLRCVWTLSVYLYVSLYLSCT